jgi:hypothetical protein
VKEWKWNRDDIKTLWKLVDVAGNMTEMTVAERAVGPEDFAEERAAVKSGAELLARVARAERIAICPDCGAELTWPLDQEKPWPCGPCNED